MPNAPWKKTGPLTFLLVVSVAFLQKVNCGGTAEVKLVSFDNPGGQLSNGDCCDRNLLGVCETGGGCDQYFIVCIDDASNTALDNLTSCAYGYVRTALTRDQANVVFDKTIGGDVSIAGTPNPLRFNFTSWPSQILVKVQVWDDNSGHTPSKVDFMMTYPPLSISAASATAVDIPWRSATAQNRTTLKMQVGVSCLANWYGAQCNVLCVPGFQYTCGNDGEKLCSAGWAGANCDQPVTIPDSGDCENNGLWLEGLCSCTPGYIGDNCETDIDDCVGINCNQGTCADGVNEFTCQCLSGYTGDNCETDIDDCVGINCNHGTCVDGINQFTCRCPSGYIGDNCETNINDCADIYCNQGYCVDGIDRYTCVCPYGYAGVNCETNINDCAGIYCNQGYCVDGIGRYTCVCPYGYAGHYCETDINDCAGIYCNQGYCVDGIGLYTCVCPYGYAGHYCETNIDDCAGIYCNQGYCVDGIGRYTCVCPYGYAGHYCETNIDDCIGINCNGGTCVDGINQFTCRCPSGYTGWPGEICPQPASADGSYSSAPDYTGLVTLCSLILSLSHYLGRTVWSSVVAVE